MLPHDDWFSFFKIKEVCGLWFSGCVLPIVLFILYFIIFFLSVPIITFFFTHCFLFWLCFFCFFDLFSFLSVLSIVWVIIWFTFVIEV